MKRKMDFTLMEDDYRKVIFRFYKKKFKKTPLQIKQSMI